MDKMKHNKKYFEQYLEDIRPWMEKRRISSYYGVGAAARAFYAQHHWRGVSAGETYLKRFGWKRSLVIFLHELGHIVAYDMEMTFIRTSKKTIESVAWAVAKILFEELNWPITQKYFNSVMYYCLKSYGVRKV